MSVLREDFREILRLVRPGSRVLDVGCDRGDLLELLTREKQVDGQGLEISSEGVSACLAKGLAVVQGDGDRDLDHFPTRAFDYAILSKTLQQMREPRHVLSELLRIAEQAVVSARQVVPISSKLTDEQANLIRTSDESARVMAARFGMSITTINDIRRGRRYRVVVSGASVFALGAKP